VTEATGVSGQGHMSKTLEQANIDKLAAEQAAYLAEAEYNRLQAERLLRVREEEDADVTRQRIFDFVFDVTDASVFIAIKRLSEWRAKSPDPITIRLNTGGGDIIAGMALYDYVLGLRNEGISVTTVGIGMVASMGGVLLQAGSTRAMTQGAWLMIHELATFNEGKLSAVKDYTKWLERVQRQCTEILSERSTLSPLQIQRRTAKGKDWWLTADEALKYGFIDVIQGASVSRPVRGEGNL